MTVLENPMYAQTALQPNPLLRNGAYGIVMRGVQKCTRGCSSLRVEIGCRNVVSN